MSIPPSFLTSILSAPTNSVPSLEDIAKDIAKKIQNFSGDIKRLKSKITYLKDLWSMSVDEQQSKEIVTAFENTVQASINQLEQYLRDQEAIKTEALILEAEFLELIIKVLASIIKFQEMLDSLYPDASKKIIDYLDQVLIALLATHMPIVALVVKISKDVMFEPLITQIKTTLSAEYLTQIKQGWQEKSQQLGSQLTTIQEGKSFQTKYQIAKQIFLLSEKTGCSPLDIAELGLNIEELQKYDQQDLSKLIASKKFMETSSINSPDKITEVINGLTQEIIKIFEKILGHSEDLKNSIDPVFLEAKENFHQALDPTKNIYTRIASSCRAVTSIFKIEKLIKDKVDSLPEGDKIILAVSKLIEEKTQTILPPSILTNICRAKTYLRPGVIIAENVIKLFFKSADLSNSRGKA